MGLAFDPAYVAAREPLQHILANRPAPVLHDIETRRSNLRITLGAAFARLPERPNVTQVKLRCRSYDGTEIDIIHSYTLSNKMRPTAAIIHAHAGGMIAGSAELFNKPVAQLVEESHIPFFSVNYRKAPEYPHPYPTEDVYAALVFVRENATKFNIDPARMGLFGESAGGGICAGVAQMARDRGLRPPIAKQILVYPMLDDKNTVPDPELISYAFWSYESNVTGWTALLGPGKVGNPDAEISPYAAPTRAVNLRGLPKTYLDTGDLDIFRDEGLAYISRLASAGVPVECHVYTGVPHAFNWIAPNIVTSQFATMNRLSAFSNL